MVNRFHATLDAFSEIVKAIEDFEKDSDQKDLQGILIFIKWFFE